MSKWPEHALRCFGGDMFQDQLRRADAATIARADTANTRADDATNALPDTANTRADTANTRADTANTGTSAQRMQHPFIDVHRRHQQEPAAGGVLRLAAVLR